jgi:hypothetical protein
MIFLAALDILLLFVLTMYVMMKQNQIWDAIMRQIDLYEMQTIELQTKQIDYLDKRIRKLEMK